MHLYLANATRQNHQVQFRVPERTSPVIMTIPPGCQAKVPGDLNTIGLDDIVKQGRAYGWAKVDEVTGSTVRGRVVTIVFSDKPIPSTRLYAAMDNNTKTLRERGKKQRDLAAVSVNQELERAFEQTPAIVRETDVEVVEQDNPNRDTSHEMISEGRRVSRDAPPESEPTSGRRRR